MPDFDVNVGCQCTWSPERTPYCVGLGTTLGLEARTKTMVNKLWLANQTGPVCSHDISPKVLREKLLVPIMAIMM